MESKNFLMQCVDKSCDCIGEKDTVVNCIMSAERIVALGLAKAEAEVYTKVEMHEDATAGTIIDNDLCEIEVTGTIAYYQNTTINRLRWRELGFDGAGNYLFLKITAPREPSENASLDTGYEQYSNWDSFKDGDDYFYYGFKVEAIGDSRTLKLAWDGVNVIEIKIKTDNAELSE